MALPNSEKRFNLKSFIEYLINNNLPSLIVSILAFAVSIIGTLIIPLCKSRKEKKQLQQELVNFKKMLVKEYLKEFTDLVDIIRETKSYLLSDVALQLEGISGKKTVRLKYMLENELIYISSQNQFKLIRMAEFTMAYFTTTQKILDTHSFNLDKSKSEALKAEELKRLTDTYLLKIEKYANLETDYLVSEKEMEEIEDKIRYA